MADLDPKRIFYSKSTKFSTVIRILDERGITVKEKFCIFEEKESVGQYYALPANDVMNELGVDELELLRKNPAFNLSFYDSKGWLGKALSTTDEVSQNIVGKLEDEILFQKEKIKQLEAIQDEVPSVNVKKVMAQPQKAAPPKKKRGRPKKG